jgi:hypothetical protein
MIDDKRLCFVHTLETLPNIDWWCLPSTMAPVEGSATALKFTEGCCREGDKLVKAAAAADDLALCCGA